MMSSRLLLALTVVGLAACGEVSNPTIDAPIDVPITIDAPGPDALDIDAPPPIDAPVGTRTVTVTKAGTGTGAVTSSAGGINCGGVCAAAVPDGTTLTLTAAPDAGSSFDGWGGACASAGTATTCTLTVTADAAITATFTRLRYPITVALAGNGLGTVVSSPAGINCPGTCSATVDHGTTVTLNAMPSGGSTFLGWSGACSGTGACVITAMAATSVTATFAQNQSLVVTKAGAGTGTVTSSPAGITCGADCSEAYAPGTVVTLTATPTGASTFQGWSGGCTGTATTCTVTVTGAVMVTATFAAPQCTLTVVKAGTGSGTVTSVPAGINCGTDCTETVACGTAITLTASAAGTSTFAGWSGSCTGSGSCSLPMTGDTTITATFNAAVVMPNLVFVTSTTHTGNLGGLAGADAICQARASAAGRAGTYRAWLSTSTTHAISRLGSASGWTLVDGRPFASSQADLAAGRIFYPISLDETGAAQPFASAWSATLGTGMWNSLDNACTNWTSTMPSGVTAGSTLGTSDSWTAHSGNPCTSALRLYCFGVDRAATVTVTPVTGRRIFMTAANWTPGGGIASADAVCASEASAAGLTGTFRALLATTTASAASRFSTTGAPWVRADGIAVTATAAELFATTTATYRVAPNLTAAGAYVDANPRRYLWSGATGLNAVGTAATTCSDWTSTSSTVMPQLAELDQATPASLFGGVGYLTCAGSQRLMCLQQ